MEKKELEKWFRAKPQYRVFSEGMCTHMVVRLGKYACSMNGLFVYTELKQCGNLPIKQLV